MKSIDKLGWTLILIEILVFFYFLPAIALGVFETFKYTQAYRTIKSTLLYDYDLRTNKENITRP